MDQPALTSPRTGLQTCTQSRFPTAVLLDELPAIGEGVRGAEHVFLDDAGEDVAEVAVPNAGIHFEGVRHIDDVFEYAPDSWL